MREINYANFGLSNESRKLHHLFDSASRMINTILPLGYYNRSLTISISWKISNICKPAMDPTII